MQVCGHTTAGVVSSRRHWQVILGQIQSSRREMGLNGRESGMQPISITMTNVEKGIVNTVFNGFGIFRKYSACHDIAGREFSVGVKVFGKRTSAGVP